MGKYRAFKANLSETQKKQFERITLEWYVYGIVVGAGAVLVWQLVGGL